MSVVYDVENYPNFFQVGAISLDRDDYFSWEISTRRNDAASLFAWLQSLAVNRVEMIGFNTLNYDYHLIHAFMNNPGISLLELFKITTRIMNQVDGGFNNTIWPNDRLIPQIDLFKLHHFDNIAKTTSLKALQFAMRSESIEDLPVSPGTYLTPDQMDTTIRYNEHDVRETKKFVLLSSEQIEFRRTLAATMQGDVMNFNDTKIGKQYFTQQLGEELCFERVGGKKQPRQTIRHTIPLADIIFPYIRFRHPEFNRILDYLKSQTLESHDVVTDENTVQRAQTKGVFKDLKATINGFDFVFGVGGIHGSRERVKVTADPGWIIKDIDVTSLYPSIAIVNRCAPAHLGDRFVETYTHLKAERKKHAKKTAPNEMLKLALNGVYGDSNNIYSVFYDPQYTMTITINGQLLLCVLAEWLMDVPTLEIIQINTDGITMRVMKCFEWMVEKICKQWEQFTMLDLEHVYYSRMWIRDVNNYLAEYADGKKVGGKSTKAKGAYSYPETIKDYDGWWHQDYSEIVSQRAAVAAMVHGVDPAQFIALHGDPFDYMLRAKVSRGVQLKIGETPVQRITRYYIARDGAPMTKVSPPVEGATIGDFKRKNGVSLADYLLIRNEIGPGVWDARIHTKNRSVYEDRITSIQAGWNVAECNKASDFRWSNLNRDYYIEQARKLVIT